jgi:hypothetical protein
MLMLTPCSPKRVFSRDTQTQIGRYEYATRKTLELVERPTTTMTLATVKRQRKSLTQLMCQSTIYQRNELRRTKTLALKDDPRPAAVRVLSGLPGFRIFIPPYQPAVTASVAAVPAALEFSQEDVFTVHRPENDANPDTKASSLTGIAAVGQRVAVEPFRNSYQGAPQQGHSRPFPLLAPRRHGRESQLQSFTREVQHPWHFCRDDTLRRLRS